MSEEDKAIAESVRSGQYFEDARAWYGAIYIRPIAERAFFLIVAVLSAIIAFVGFRALVLLMPLTTKPALMISANGRMDEVVPRLVPIRKRHEDLQSSIVKFFISNYITRRESFSAATYLSNAQAIKTQSTESIYTAFIAQYSSANPASPAAQLGETGERRVTIDDVNYTLNKQSGTATVKFSTELAKVTPANTSRWTVKIGFNYTNFASEETKNAETGAIELRIQDPQFQVVSYELSQD